MGCAVLILALAGGVAASVVLSRPPYSEHATATPSPLKMTEEWLDAVQTTIGELGKARGADAIVALEGDTVIARWGDVDERYNVASIRKSVVSCLCGIAMDKGLIDPRWTLKQLGIQESRTPLTDGEQSATIYDLLQARSGSYLPTRRNPRDGDA